MISIEQLKVISRIKGLSLGYAEKDYIIDLCLQSISRRTKDELVFKGGTCLLKFYRLDRFSEDIDFTARSEIDLKALFDGILSDLRLFGLEATILTEKQSYNTCLVALRTKGPLYKGSPQTLSKIKIDINLKSSLDLEPRNMSYSSIYQDIPKITLLVMDENEIFAEKVRAIMTRDKARDVYDIWFMLGRGIRFDFGLIEKKLEYYKESWSKAKFLKAVRGKEKIWKTEMKPLIEDVPDFEKAKALIVKSLEKLEAG